MVILWTVLHQGVLLNCKIPASLFTMVYATFLITFSSDGGVQLTEEEKSEVLSVLPVGITNSETDRILEILSQAHCSASTIQEEDVIEQLQV